MDRDVFIQGNTTQQWKGASAPYIDPDDPKACC